MTYTGTMIDDLIQIVLRYEGCAVDDGAGQERELPDAEFIAAGASTAILEGVA